MAFCGATACRRSPAPPRRPTRVMTTPLRSPQPPLCVSGAFALRCVGAPAQPAHAHALAAAGPARTRHTLPLPHPTPIHHARQRYPGGDKSCEAEIGPTIAGYCLCEGNITTGRRAAAAAGNNGMLSWRGGGALESAHLGLAHARSCLLLGVGAQLQLLSPMPAPPRPQGDVRAQVVHMRPEVR